MKTPRGAHVGPSQGGNENNNLISNQRRDLIAPETAGANVRTPPNAQYPPRASSLSPRAFETSSAGSSEGTADDSFASIITVVPLQRVGRSLWQPPGSPGAAIDPPRASTDSFRARAFGSRLRAESSVASGSSRGEDQDDPFVDLRSRTGTTETAGSSTPLINPPPRAHTVQRGREQRRDLSGGRQSIETTPGDHLEVPRSITTTTSKNNSSSSSSSGSRNSNLFSCPTTNISHQTTTTSLNTGFNNINLSSPLRARTNSILAMKDGHNGPDDLSRLSPGAKDKSVFGSIKRGINNLGSIRGRKTPGNDSPRSHGEPSGDSRTDISDTPSSSTIKNKKSLANMFGSLKAAMTPKPKAQAAFELQPFPSEQSMIEGLLLHGPQRLELARGGNGRYAAKDKNGPVYPPRLPLEPRTEPRTEPRRGDPNSGRFLSSGPALSAAETAAGECSRSSRPDLYEDKPLPPLPRKN